MQNIRGWMIAAACLAVVGGVVWAFAPHIFWRSAVQKKVAEHLMDPGSARFEMPGFVSGASTYCGWVNGKNAFGAYVGRRPFRVMVTASGPFLGDHYGLVLLDLAQNDDEAKAVYLKCAEDGYMKYYAEAITN